MRILLILLLTISVNPSKADEIFNLIKIPNLEIYTLKSKNRLKYLIAKQDFKIGFENNITCNKPNKKNLNKKFLLIKKNLEKYDFNFLNKINLRFIVMCENLLISGINTGGIPDHNKRTLILDLKFPEKYFERVIHHEIFHIIHDTYKSMFNETTWKKFNKENFKYSECSTCSNRLGLDLYEKTNGFLTEYSKSIASEDMAEVYSFIITDNTKIEKKIKLDPVLLNKVKYIKTRIEKIKNF